MFLSNIYEINYRKLYHTMNKSLFEMIIRLLFVNFNTLLNYYNNYISFM